ncbi:hypothetical protein [Amaricoccus sp.]|uniref:hypothetical protein n=1 Tax=Amaricoccus sp. TaxID=1872485 RepID=UPI001B5664F5|nr:hypothetical protein [Amaricoccus sp.]MBP7001152.1 hypothetical protein [Amaricoccus sp.]
MTGWTKGWRGGLRLAPLLALLAVPAAAQDEDDARLRAWGTAKCAAYAKAWDAVLLGQGTEGLGADFLRGNEAFIASGCREGREVCPQGPQEIAAADMLTIAAMNMGAASTFLPFRC